MSDSDTENNEESNYKDLLERVEKAENWIQKQTKIGSAFATAQELSNKSKDATKEIGISLDYIRDTVNDADKLKKASRSSASRAEKHADTSDVILKEIGSRQIELDSLAEQAKARLEQLENIFTNHPNLPEELKIWETNFNNATEYLEKITTLHDNSLNNHGKISQLWKLINGYEEEEEDGEVTKIDGLKKELDDSYNELKTKADAIADNIIDVEAMYGDKHKVYINEWKNKYTALSKEIKELIPEAAQKGLAAAYFKRREQEEGEARGHKKTFLWGIGGLIFVALISAIPSVYLIVEKDAGFVEVMEKLPIYLPVMLPLYIPVLWVAYSGSRKLSLSKRLIEEYAHKESLSRTYQGLSDQIKKIDDNKELKTELMYTILAASAENPGKLIKDYNKADHPVMDALEKAAKLSTAVDVITKLPGFGKIANVVNARLEKTRAKQEEKSNRGADDLKDIEVEKDDENDDENDDKY